MPDDPHEERDGHDGKEHPQPDRGVEAQLGVGHCDTEIFRSPQVQFFEKFFTEIVFESVSCFSCSAAVTS